MTAPGAATATAGPTASGDAPAISVLVCTRNPRPDHLARVLAALRAQTLAASRWELLLVDNASTPPLAGRVALDVPAAARHLRVEPIGKPHALLVGIAQSRGRLLVTVDDDNVVDPRFLEAALDFCDRHPFVGMVNGVVDGELERVAAPAIWRYREHLVIRDLGPAVQWSFTPGFEALACWGAGMVMRRAVAERWAAGVAAAPDAYPFARRGRSLAGGEDGDLALAAQALGLALAYTPALRLRHLIPAARTRPAYFRRLVHGNLLAGHRLLLLRGLRAPPPARPAWLRAAAAIRRALADAALVALGRLDLMALSFERAARRGIRDAEDEARRAAAASPGGPERGRRG